MGANIPLGARFIRNIKLGGGYSLFNNPRFLRVGTRTERRLWSRDSAERFSEADTRVAVFVVMSKSRVQVAFACICIYA